jgi:hypothetical protein
LDFVVRVAFGSWVANAWSRNFLRHFDAGVRRAFPERAPEVLERTRVAASELFESRRRSLPDVQGRLVLAMSSLVLAGFRELSARLGRERAHEITREAFQRTYRSLGKFMYRPLLWFSREPVRALARMDFERWGRRMYGASMGIGQERSPDRVTLVIHRCAFHEFFADHGEPQLTKLLCAWDRHWMDVLDASRRPVRTERPTTLSTGGDCCRFHFLRDPDKLGKPKVDVILEQPAGAQRTHSP